MFEVQHEDDAWDLGVLKACGFFDSPAGSQSAADLGVPVHLVEFFVAGQHDSAALSASRVTQLACRWDVSTD